ncbi:relaxase/mobilization nuclease domain-containing protein (plasmid) [Streptosporangium sp. CA-135522]|uniref:relaxase/mobilization nuclease domain-containing protein n=1 Tax=Streptosporangium sp. CA-135522 TaxID=3240072 RepID=UPI003D917F3B
MIAKVLYGKQTVGLLNYLYGPGAHEEHVNPHLVASWDGREPDPARAPSGSPQREDALWRLARKLDRPLGGYPGTISHHVWHLPVRCAPGDGTLTDAQWNRIARRLVAAAGIAPFGDDYGCRWVAVRHADDHIHIVATLARQDGRRLPDLRGDWFRLRNECRAIEEEHGLQVTAAIDRSAACRPTRGEQDKAHRIFTPQTPAPLAPTAREHLAVMVRQVALTAISEADFFVRLQQGELNVYKRTLPSGQLVGYAVNYPGDLARDGKPVWFSGSRLAPDLSLPRVRQRWADADEPKPAMSPRAAAVATRQGMRPTQPQLRAMAWQHAAGAISRAREVLDAAGDEHGAAVTAALADLLTAAASQAPKEIRRELVIAARAFERCGRVPWRAQHEASRRMRGAARVLIDAGQALASGDEAAAVLATVVVMVAAARAVAARYRLQKMHAHAQAARLAAAHLQDAGERLGARPRAHADHRAAARSDLHAALRRAVTGQADPEAILVDPAWPVLAGLMARVEYGGADSGAVLRAVTMQRRLRTDPSSPSRSETQVLAWRLQNWLTDRESTPQSEHERTTIHPATIHPATIHPARNHPPTGLVLRSNDPPVLQRAVREVVAAQACTSSMLQRRLGVDRVEAARLMQVLRERGVLGGDGGLPRVLLRPADVSRLQAAEGRMDAVLVQRAAKHVIAAQCCTPEILQRNLEVSASDAHVLMGALERQGVIGPGDVRRREVLITPAGRAATLAPPSGADDMRRPMRPQKNVLGGVGAGEDLFFRRAVTAVVQVQECSVPMLGKALWVTEAKAFELIGQLQERGVVGAREAGGRYPVLISREDLARFEQVVTPSRHDAARLASPTSSTPPAQPKTLPPVSPPGPGRHPRRRR